MVTNYPQQLTAEAGMTHEHGQHGQDDGAVARAVSRVSQLLCGLRGHDSVLHFERNRVNMRCTSCGHDTPGWGNQRTRPAPPLRRRRAPALAYQAAARAAEDRLTGFARV
jgi:hypothetical protein